VRETVGGPVKPRYVREKDFHPERTVVARRGGRFARGRWRAGHGHAAHLELVADWRVGLELLYRSRNPLAFMDLQNVQELSDFFERRVSAYRSASPGRSTSTTSSDPLPAGVAARCGHAARVPVFRSGPDMGSEAVRAHATTGRGALLFGPLSS
jgi:hypothetical protein